ncbi:MAG: cysteine desulfurase, partial [Planctomycetes bacterium]|nr:cysteine desulfurase [Planctomycetota bacterium]
LVCAERSAKLVVVPVGDQGEVELEDFVAALGPKTRFASFAQVSNALGTVLPTKAMVEACRQRGIPCLVDGAQAVPHLPVNVQDLDCDFFVFSGHKVYAPSGVGALYGRKALLDAMPPWQGGGDMILSVSFEGSRWNAAPFKFEAGTPNIEGAIGLGVALEWLKAKGLDRVAAWEHELLEAANSGLQGIDGVRLIGTAPGKAAVVSFVLDGVHPHDIGTCLDQDGVAIRVGHHCAEPIMHRFGVPATARASFGIYNTMADVEAFVASVGKVQEMFGNV